MATSVVSAFKSFDEKLNLDPRERERAQARHHELRDVLEASGLIDGTFLQGSFARKTMLKPLKDVDIVVLLNPDLGFEGGDGPALAMDRFRGLVAEVWPTARFDIGEAPAAKALRVEFNDLPFTFDLVPAFDGAGEWVLIGDRERRHWEPSNTRIQRHKVAELNVRTGGSFVHQVRMLKAFVKRQPEEEFAFFKGIAVESVAYQSIQKRLPHDEAIATALRDGAVLLTGPVMEPAGDDDVSIKWAPHEREAAVGAFNAGATAATEAVGLRQAGDERAAIEIWHSLFGADFPAAPAQSLEETLRKWASGSVTSTGRTSATVAGASPAAPGRAWRR